MLPTSVFVVALSRRADVFRPGGERDGAHINHGTNCGNEPLGGDELARPMSPNAVAGSVLAVTMRGNMTSAADIIIVPSGLPNWPFIFAQ